MRNNVIFLLFAGMLVSNCKLEEKVTSDGSIKPNTDQFVSSDGMLQPDSAPMPTGNATITFVPKWGSTYKVQFDALWMQSIPGYDGDSTLVMMLCESSDPTCLKPKVIHEITSTEKEDKIIQNSYGPTVTVGNLPAGSWKLMVFADSTVSRKLKYGWNDKFSTKEKEWGGIVSESDIMLNDPQDPPKSAYNPPPKSMDITLTDGQTLDLKDLILAHYHQRDISADAKPENGLVVVATETGARVIDLNTYKVKEAGTFSGTVYYDYPMVDSSGNTFSGRVCGIVPGPNKSVFLLYLNATKDRAGFAVQFDPITGKQMNGNNRVLFPGSDQDFPCRGIYHENGAEKYLWVTNKAGDGAAAFEGIWYSNIKALSSGDVDATLISSTESNEDVYKAGIDQIAAVGSTLYFAANASQAPCSGGNCVFKASYDQAGRPTITKTNGAYAALVGPTLKDDFISSMGTIKCVTSAPYAGMAIAKFHNGHNLLFLGGCLEVSVFDLDAADKKLDFNGPVSGTPGLDATLFGQGFINFSLAPDGKTLWAVSLDKSVVHLYFEKGTSGTRQSYNRWMFLPIDLSQGDLPAVSPDFNKTNIDGFKGVGGSVGTYQSPEIDPGLDLDFAFLKQYIVKWAGDLAGATPTSIPIAPTIAVGNNTLWMRGSGVSGVSGLANQGNLGVFSLSEQKLVLWPRGEKSFYEVWMGNVNTNWGYDLTPENELSLATSGLVYIPLP